ncbi:hypothetical protein RDWZM_001340 [Blomia tropicalis]|uniref:Uncharacterized protein n=1 Tax=Blomia tropicalis TaxID=40697 RepID=A0A9Q0MBE9_BLOTA|nr:hypothetical protein RDWZM_001340 [Blomia tropicalis]
MLPVVGGGGEFGRFDVRSHRQTGNDDNDAYRIRIEHESILLSVWSGCELERALTIRIRNTIG